VLTEPPEQLAGVARADLGAPIICPLADVLSAHGATLVSQLDAFEAYVAEAEREGADKYPLYRWTKATLDDPAKRAKHARAFAVRIAGQEVYPKAAAEVPSQWLLEIVGDVSGTMTVLRQAARSIMLLAGG
jgi:hypothetical protein